MKLIHYLVVFSAVLLMTPFAHRIVWAEQSISNEAWSSLRLIWTNPNDPDEFLGVPVGNGRIGAKIRGAVGKETLTLNNKTFWSSWPQDETNPARQKAMLETRARLAAGDYDGAEQSAKGMWGTSAYGGYLPLGSLQLEFDHGDTAKAYSRELHLDRALAVVKYTIGDVTFTRETFASHPDRVIVMRLSASQPRSITFSARLVNPVEMGPHGSSSVEGADTLVMRGRAPASDHKTWDPQRGMRHETRVRVSVNGGKLTTLADRESLRVEDADSVEFLISDATSYNGYEKEPGTQGVDPSPAVRADIESASAKKYEELLQAHLDDYRSLFRRVWVEIGPSGPLASHALNYQFARYSMIQASRKGDLPHNLLGMWSSRWNGYSKGVFFLNENVQKYYGIIETGNLAETGEPLWNWMTHVAVRGRDSAKIDWGFNGWVVGHCTDIWASTSLRTGNNEWAVWPSGGFWLCHNLYDHYAFNRDKTFLRDRAYPILRGAAEFALDYLVEDKDGFLSTSPATSPENRFALEDRGKAYAVTLGSTMDHALIRELFENVISASQDLDVDAEFRAKLEKGLSRIRPFAMSRRDSSRGELQEWGADHSRLPEDSRKRFTPHRHTSHLVAVWPLRQITEAMPELFAAAKLALQNRGSGGYHPDKAAMWARLKEGDKALQTLGGRGHHVGGLFPPLYSAFSEMLLQSHTGEIDLLPALPSTWPQGRILGLRARGGYELSLTWAERKLGTVTIRSVTGNNPKVRYGNQRIQLTLSPGQSVKLDAGLRIIN